MNSELKEKIIDLLQNKGIYSSIKLTIEEYKILCNTLNELNSLDLYCLSCKAEKTFVFSLVDGASGYGRILSNSRIYEYILAITYKCPTCNKKVVFVLVFDNDKLIKIGQYPSLIDVSRNEINKYKKIKLIDEDYFEELKKAEVCACESYYVASFLYLRRVFENLITNIYEDNKEEIEAEREIFSNKTLEDKLKILKPFLAIENEVYKTLYKLLSEGLHNLPEDQCEQNYELLKFILLDILEEQESKKRKKENRSKLHSLISQNKGGNENEE